jgi:hypothetical protein
MNDKLKAVVEAAGECWHTYQMNRDNSIATWCEECLKDAPNPSPTDLNELFRLASLLVDGLVIDVGIKSQGWMSVMVKKDGVEYRSKQHTTPAEALLNALTEAISR